MTAGKFPFGANGRALALNATEGFVKLVARKEDGLLLGAQIVGQGASDMIAELGLAIEAWYDCRRYCNDNSCSPNIR